MIQYLTVPPDGVLHGGHWQIQALDTARTNCKVLDENQVCRFGGTFFECETWLAAKGLALLWR